MLEKLKNRIDIEISFFDKFSWGTNFPVSQKILPFFKLMVILEISAVLIKVY